MRTIADDWAQLAGSSLKPPLESPHLDFPERKSPFALRGYPGITVNIPQPSRYILYSNYGKYLANNKT